MQQQVILEQCMRFLGKVNFTRTGFSPGLDCFFPAYNIDLLYQNAARMDAHVEWLPLQSEKAENLYGCVYSRFRILKDSLQFPEGMHGCAKGPFPRHLFNSVKKVRHIFPNRVGDSISGLYHPGSAWQATGWSSPFLQPAPPHAISPHSRQPRGCCKRGCPA